MRFTVRAGTPDDVPLVLAWRDEARHRIEATHGIRQWHRPMEPDEVLRAVYRGELHIAHRGGIDGEPVATVTIDDHAATFRWTAEERSEPARYVHKLYVAPGAAPGLGSALLDWAGRRAGGDGAVWLRLDAWTANARLRHYYEDQGFTLVRVVPDLESGALYQRRATVELARHPSLIIMNDGGRRVPFNSDA